MASFFMTRPMTGLLYHKRVEPANIAHLLILIPPMCNNILAHIEVKGHISLTRTTWSLSSLNETLLKT